MTAKMFQGKCLCGSVSVSTQLSHEAVDVCHCSICRKWGGGPFMAVGVDNQTTWNGEEHIGVYDSSEWAERGFCKKCGTHLFYHLKDTSIYAFPAGLIEGTEAFPFTKQIFIEEKPANYEFANKTENLTGEEVFAQFSQEQ